MDSEEEMKQNLILAYGIMVYNHVCQFERLLKAIWRPSHIYCIHIDSDASPIVLHNYQELLKCFPNMFLSSRRVDVRWGEFSVLEADLICMKDLLTVKSPNWSYYLNLNSHEYPLKTNLELLKILKILNGANSIHKTMPLRWRFNNRLPPINVTLWKGEFHIIACRGFVDYVINNQIAQQLINWSSNTAIPDETVNHQTINHNPQLGAPGSYAGLFSTKFSPYFHRFKHWYNECPYGAFDCSACGSQEWRSGICIMGLRDLARLTDLSNPALFVNKIFSDFQPRTLDCLESWHTKRIRDELEIEMELNDGESVNYNFYRSLNVIKYHVPCAPFQVTT